MALGDYLKASLSADGADYDPLANYLPSPPGTERRYCNTCYALLGYLAEAIADVPFQQLSQEILFDRLGMLETAWFLRDLADASVPAMPYRFAADSGFVAYGQNGYPDWPAGQLRSSIRDLGRFLAAYASGGRGVIDPTVIDLMAPRNAEVGFHTWSQLALRNRGILYLHQGRDLGVSSVLGFHRPTTRGVVVVANGVGQLFPIFEEVFLAIASLSAVDNRRGRR